MPTTPNTVLTTSINTIHTLGWLQKLVRHQAEEYLASKPYYLDRNPWLDKNLNRLVAQEPIKPRKKNGTSTCPDMMHEDLLLTISDNLIYRKTLIGQATRYKNLLLKGFPDCKDLDLEWALNKTCGLLPPDPGMSLKQRQDRLISHRNAIRKVESNLELIAEAKLFASPSSGYERHQEPKSAIYLALMMAFAEKLCSLAKKPTTPKRLIEVLKAGKWMLLIL